MMRLNGGGWLLTLYERLNLIKTLALSIGKAPPIGSPGRSGHAGNSTPVRSLVAGGSKSEHFGELLA